MRSGIIWIASPTNWFTGHTAVGPQKSFESTGNRPIKAVIGGRAPATQSPHGKHVRLPASPLPPQTVIGATPQRRVTSAKSTVIPHTPQIAELANHVNGSKGIEHIAQIK
jgi:hypothetical protein